MKMDRFLDHVQLAQLRDIKDRWSKWSVSDIAFEGPMPPTRQTVEDIYVLLTLVEEIPDAYEKGHADAAADYQSGFADGFDEAKMDK